MRASALGDFGRRARARGGLVLLGVLAVLGMMLVQSGSAATTTKPYTANFCTTLVDNQCPATSSAPAVTVPVGASTLYLTLVNNTGTQNLGSFNLGAYSGFTFTGASFVAKSSTTGDFGTSAFPGTLLGARDLNIAPGGYVTVGINLTAPCSIGSQDWSSLIETKQANNFSGAPGNDLTLTQPSNLTTRTSECHLKWQVQPTSTKINTIITGAPYDPTAGTLGYCYSGSYPCWVEVDAVDDSGNVVTSVNSGTVSLTPSSNEGFTNTTSLQFSNGRALFKTLAAGGTTGDGYTFIATAPGFIDSPPSSAFNVTYSGEPCNVANGCPKFTTPLQNGAQVDSSSGPGFAFIAIDQANLPGTPPHGCLYYQTLGNGALTETDGRIGPAGVAGTLQFTYAIPNKLIKQTSNNGQPFVPICAGAAWVDGSGTVRRCDDPNAPIPWMGDGLNADGTLNGSPRQSECDPATGLDWGILGTYQDKWITSGTDPMVTAWKSDSKFRSYFISVPPPWDYSMG